VELETFGMGEKAMSVMLEVEYQDARSALILTPLEKKASVRIHKIALDGQGRPCRLAWQTWDGIPLPAGGLAQGYESIDGNTILKTEVMATDADGHPLRLLPATATRVQRLEGPVTIDEFLSHVISKVYIITAHRLDPALQQSLQQGDIYRVAFRLKASTSDLPAFLIANASGIFLLKANPCRIEWITKAQVVHADADDMNADELSDWDDWNLNDIQIAEEELI
jgi:hypothetical protein